MPLTVLLLAGVLQAEEAKVSLPMPPLAYAGIAAGILLAMLVITWAFRSVGKRH